MDPKLSSLCRFGGWCALIAGACYVGMVVCAFLLPPSIASYVATEAFFADFVGNESIFIALKCLMLVASGAMIGVTIAFFGLSREESYGLMAWVTVMALIGYGVNMLQSVQDIGMIPHLVTEYGRSPEGTRSVIRAIGVTNVAWFALSMGLPGIWFVVVSLRAITNRYIPRILLVFGLLWGVGNLLTVVAHILVILPLIYLVAAGAMVIAPLWSIAEGVYLLRLSRRELPYAR
jgi:hypothetical protein